WNVVYPDEARVCFSVADPGGLVQGRQDRGPVLDEGWGLAQGGAPGAELRHGMGGAVRRRPRSDRGFPLRFLEGEEDQAVRCSEAACGPAQDPLHSGYEEE